MDTTGAVLAGTIVITGSKVFADTANGHFTMQPVVSGFLLGSALLLLGMIVPSIAKALVALGCVGAFVTNGPTIIDRVSKLG